MRLEESDALEVLAALAAAKATLEALGEGGGGQYNLAEHMPGGATSAP